ncbi:Heat shock protein Hsp20 [Pyrolobus fumarii 1A]|uniref:Heat shock protein Hsp20 n=1 Tax=Pyrolobus fumarii (strain DSM 11204 / 1A) TaxID=694429 RepID=G0EHJ7_PYRF1|nr:archaeal heat shock protein Hsp20 [Pyrolobus fumarii]AEM39350.1 Heat shock protein Hsp20 [Pyrolobus fumarii 1A]
MAWGRRYRSIFEWFDEVFRSIEEEIAALERELMELVRSGRAEVRGPYIYGFRIVIGPDGKPIIEEFGNIKRRYGRTEILEEREPLVDVFEDEDKITVIAELPGVDKDKIKVRIKDNKLIIRASNGQKYYKEVELPAKVKPETAKARYKNGVLEVVIEKEKPKKVVEEIEEGHEVKVE